MNYLKVAFFIMLILACLRDSAYHFFPLPLSFCRVNNRAFDNSFIIITISLVSYQATPINLKKGLLLANKYTPNPQYFACASPEVPIIQRESLVFLHDIGEGCFGKVYKGTKLRAIYCRIYKKSIYRYILETYLKKYISPNRIFDNHTIYFL